MVAKVEHHEKSICPVACALDIIGDHWTLLIIRDLMFMNKHEYKEFLSSEEGISSNILSDRLKRLEQTNTIGVIAHPYNKLRKLYYLTEQGKELIYVILDIAKWSDKFLSGRIFIADEMRPLLDSPIEDIVAMVHLQLNEWEQTHLL